MASAGGAFGGARGLAPSPPEKGVFPLDHYGECKEVMSNYMKCLKDNKYDGDKCRAISKAYLECRMERNLMAQQSLAELGFTKDGGTVTPVPSEDDFQPSPSPPSAPKKTETGFVAGMPYRKP
eukprot:TRINITY_DN10333_c0_g1_i1.p1 TRINITY_DN10333_c0_g1~~TRINITY_DN10333_c0_g1_i1.p1  ORF type:complete len:123 (-),score=18.15 TRINITY_DN10333_c0_g1_i1:209-577(-)